MIGACGHITVRAVLSWLLIRHLQLPAVALASGTGWMLVNLFWALVYAKAAMVKPSVKINSK